MECNIDIGKQPVIKGLYARHCAPTRVDICGDQAGIEGLLKVVRDLIDPESRSISSDTVSTKKNVRSVELDTSRSGDYTRLTFSLIDRDSRKYSDYWKGSDDYPIRYRDLLEQRVEDVDPPVWLELVYGICNNVEYACSWRGCVLMAAYSTKEIERKGYRMRKLAPASGALDCQRCGRAISPQASLPYEISSECNDLYKATRPVNITDEEPWSYLEEQSESVFSKDGPPFLIASIDDEGTIDILGDIDGYKDMERESARFASSDEEYDHVHYPLYRNFPTELSEIVLVRDDLEASRPTPNAADGIIVELVPDCVGLRYMVCARESGSCGWQGWVLESAYKFADKTSKNFNDGIFLNVGDDWLCPNCSRHLVSLGFDTWYALMGAEI